MLAKYKVHRDAIDSQTGASAEEYWEFMNDVVPPVVKALRDVDDYLREMVRDEVFESFNDHKKSNDLMDYGARLINIRKPA